MVTFKEVSNFHFIEDSYGNYKVQWFLNVEMPLYDQQVQRLTDELATAKDNNALIERIYNNYLTNITQNYYGSFCLEFNYDMMSELTDQELAEFNEELEYTILESNIVEAIMLVSQFQWNETLDDDFNVDWYIESLKNAGYGVSMDDIDCVPEHLHKEFQQALSLLILKGEAA